LLLKYAVLLYNPSAMYDAEYTRKFYNAYGNTEWSRLERSPHGRLQAIIHNDFIERYIKPGMKVLDAGSGPGRFTIAMARLGARVAVLDISDVQLDLARKNISEANLTDHVDKFILGDITDLSLFPDSSFDVVVCFGGALSYVCEHRQKAAWELIRVTRPGGFILVSVMSRLGILLGLADVPEFNLLNEPDKEIIGSSVWAVLEHGDLKGFPSPRAGMMHAAMHLYTAEELGALFPDCQILEVCGSNVMISEQSPQHRTVADSPAAWNTVVELERCLNHDPGLVNRGSHIILAARKRP
jgi:ubiquinone/menaquinone biosynthesis C-methylase UbiE